MSDTPSWLTEENAKTAVAVTQNPAVQKAAKNPAVQNAAKGALTTALSDSGNAPAWASAPPSSTKSDIEAPSTGSSEFHIEEETLKAMQRWHIAVRVFYMIASILMCAAAVVVIINSTSSNLGIIFFAFYTVFFSTMICCFEFALNVIARLIATNFGFMYTLLGRMVFLAFVGFMSFSLSLFGKISMAILFAAGLFHVYVMWRFPRFEEYLRKKHYYEGKNFE
eukprot:gene6646-9122_t